MKKNISIELLRIISMLMIVAYHWQIHALGDGIYKSALSKNQIFSFLIGSWGTLGVNLFFAISAYFLCRSEKINVSKLFQLALKVSIYGTGVVLIANCLNLVPFSMLTTIKAVLGVFAYQYWFITVYVVLYIIHPALNSILKIASDRYMSFMLLATILFVYLVAFAAGDQFLGRLACGITIYLTIGFLERHPIMNIFKKYANVGSLFFLTSIFVGEIVLSMLGENVNSLFYSCIRRIQDTHSPIMFLTSLFVFYAFINISLKENKLIVFLGKMSVGAYMVHGGASFIKDILWDGLLNAGMYYNKPLMEYGIHYVGAVILIFSVGVVVEYFYTKIIDRGIVFVLSKIPLNTNLMFKD